MEHAVDLGEEMSDLEADLCMRRVHLPCDRCGRREGGRGGEGQERGSGTDGELHRVLLGRTLSREPHEKRADPRRAGQMVEALGYRAEVAEFKPLQRLLKEQAYQAIPVIIISTEGKEEDTIRGLRMGAKGYVKKPFQASELHGLIEKITAS